MKFLITGLGNVGEAYSNTRHNIGFMILDQLATEQAVSFQPARLGKLAIYKHRGRTLHLLKPTTYMNVSGKAVRYWLNQLKIPLAKSLVIVDDIALPLGKLRIRSQGSAAGHNGLQSIEDSLATKAYPRLRIGIGNDFSRGCQVDYVLGQFTTAELQGLSSPIETACQAITAFCTLGITRTMERYN